MSEESVLNKVNVRRLVNVVKGRLEESLDNYLFESNEPPDLREYVEQQANTIWTASPEARIEVRGKTYLVENKEGYVRDIVALLEAGEECQVDVYFTPPKSVQCITFTAKFNPESK